LNELALFAGAGGGILGGKLLGWRTVCAVELNPFSRRVLMQRQNDRLLPPFPIWDDILTFDGKPWRGIVDVVSGGFPCQDISVAGTGKGLGGEKSGLWTEMFRIICEIRPRIVFVENSPALVSRGLGKVLGDLASMGFDAKWGVLGAHHVGAPHKRDRIWIFAYSNSDKLWNESEQFKRKQNSTLSSDNGQKKPLANANSMRKLQSQRFKSSKRRWASNSSWWGVESGVGRVADGVAYRVDRLKALGNGQVPAVARKAFIDLAPWGKGPIV